MRDNEWFKNTEKILIEDEGLRLSPYRDRYNNWTIGVGYFIGPNLENLKISSDVALQMLEEKIFEAEKDVELVFGEDLFASFTDARKTAIVSMMFTLGLNRFQKFYMMINSIRQGNWRDAASHAKNSKWAHDVDPKNQEGKGRDDRLANMIRSGEYDEYYKIGMQA